MNQKNICELLCETAEGNMNALAELYDMLSLRIFNYARTIIKNKESAEDITHDVFLQINKQAAHIAEVPNPTAYIMTIVRNCSLNLIKRGNNTSLSLDENGGSEITDNVSPYESIIFEDAFSGLPANQRETVYLHLICGFSLNEISEMQKTPLVTVKWRYGKALFKLRAYFAQNNQDNQDKKGENCNDIT